MIRYGGWFWLALLFALPIVAFGWALFLAIMAVGIIAVAITGRVVQPAGRHRPAPEPIPERSVGFHCQYCGYPRDDLEGTTVLGLIAHYRHGDCQ